MARRSGSRMRSLYDGYAVAAGYLGSFDRRSGDEAIDETISQAGRCSS
jgi:hypothetical protein